MPILTSTETLFGGLLGVFVLYMLARRLGLSNYWSGVLGGVIPFLAYLGYSSVVAQGGDMMAIHLAVFLATAAVLGVFGAIRKEKLKMPWGPKLIAAFFGFLVIFMAVLLSISSHGLPDKISGLFLPNPDKQRLHTAFPGVIPHDQNTLYEPHMKKIEAQRNLGWTVDIGELEKLRSDVPGNITVRVQDADGKPVLVEQVEIAMWRMANSGDDRHVQLKPLGDGVFGGEVTFADPGRWIIGVTVTRGQDVFSTQRSLFIDEPTKK